MRPGFPSPRHDSPRDIAPHPGSDRPPVERTCHGEPPHRSLSPNRTHPPTTLAAAAPNQERLTTTPIPHRSIPRTSTEGLTGIPSNHPMRSVPVYGLPLTHHVLAHHRDTPPFRKGGPGLFGAQREMSSPPPSATTSQCTGRRLRRRNKNLSIHGAAGVCRPSPGRPTHQFPATWRVFPLSMRSLGRHSLCRPYVGAARSRRAALMFMRLTAYGRTLPLRSRVRPITAFRENSR